MPKQIDYKFAPVQLAVSTVIVFGAGIKIDGQLAPASFATDPRYRITGGFTMSSWFGEGNPDPEN